MKAYRCGVWPLNLPRWFVFTPQCRFHDEDYEMARAEFLSQLAYASCLGVVEIKIDRPHWRNRIKLADGFFAKSLQYKVERMGPVGRMLYAPVATAMILMVKKLGWKVWRRGTLNTWMERQR